MTKKQALGEDKGMKQVWPSVKNSTLPPKPAGKHVPASPLINIVLLLSLYAIKSNACHTQRGLSTPYFALNEHSLILLSRTSTTSLLQIYPGNSLLY